MYIQKNYLKLKKITSQSLKANDDKKEKEENEIKQNGLNFAVDFIIWISWA